MKVPSKSDLVARARELVHRMHDVERWAYAVDATQAPETWTAAIARAGYVVAEEDRAARVVRYEAPSSSAVPTPDVLVTLERPDLGVVLFQAYGATTVDRLGAVLESTGFVPQSLLLERAYAVGLPGASKALTTLAHMVVRWDEDWSDLFLLHLASPDPVARHEAALAAVVAAFSARQPEPAASLLREARDRESFPKLRDTLEEAVKAVEAMKLATEAPPLPEGGAAE
jgi:hypothetical protein